MIHLTAGKLDVAITHSKVARSPEAPGSAGPPRKAQPINAAVDHAPDTGVVLVDQVGDGEGISATKVMVSESNSRVKPLLGSCQEPSVSPQRRPLVLPGDGQLFSPRWWRGAGRRQSAPGAIALELAVKAV